MALLEGKRKRKGQEESELIASSITGARGYSRWKFKCIGFVLSGNDGHAVPGWGRR